MSDSTGKLAEALAKAQGAMTAAHFDKRGNYGAYASLASIIEAVRKPLAQNGIAIVQELTSDAAGVQCTTRLLHVSGESLSSTFRVPVEQQTAQKYGSAATYAKRYSLASLLCVVADEDDDGEAASAKAPSQQQAKPEQISPRSNRTDERAHFGTAKGKEPREFTDKELQWYLGKAQDSVENGKPEYEQRNRIWLKLIEEEIEVRLNTPTETPALTSAISTPLTMEQMKALSDEALTERIHHATSWMSANPNLDAKTKSAAETKLAAYRKEAATRIKAQLDKGA